MPTTKIATCCYCGTRAALELRGRVQHELACSACGAPLHNLKQMPIHQPEHHADHRVDYRADRATAPAAAPARPTSYSSKKNKKKRKSVKRRVAKGLFDLIEDIFD